jgi:Nucleotidyl transferase AbiEii toxin, Type IV TA system
MKAELGGTGWILEVDPEMPDGQCLVFHNPTVFPAGVADYMRSVVKIKLGARSDDWAHESKSIIPYVIKLFPALVRDAAFPVQVLDAERTFWEKACLLHEETLAPPITCEKSAWPATTTISGASSKLASAKEH